jgi:hypothetical protein
VLRWLDWVLESTEDAVPAEHVSKDEGWLNPEPFLVRTAGQIFYDTPSMGLRKLMGHQDHVRDNPIRGGTGTPPKRGCLLDCPPSRVGQISFGPGGHLQIS